MGTRRADSGYARFDNVCLCLYVGMKKRESVGRILQSHFAVSHVDRPEGCSERFCVY